MASGDVLIAVPNATVYQVVKSNHAVAAIANGSFTVSSQHDDSGLQAEVGTVRWRLGRWAASLRFDDHTYAFQLPQLPYDSSDGYYYCVTLDPQTDPDLIDLLQAVLSSGSAYQDHSAHLQPLPPLPPTEAAAAAAAAPAPAPGQPPAAAVPSGPGQTAAAAAPPTRQHEAQAHPGAPSAKSERLAAGLQKGGLLAAAGVMAAATWASGAIQRSAEAAVAKLQPSERQHPHLSPEAQARLERAKSMASKAADVSGRAVSGALSVTAKVAGVLAQRLSETEMGNKLRNGRVAGASAQDVRRVGAAGMEAMEAVYEALDEAARLVLAHVGAAATRVAGHKYGPGAAQATGAGVQVAQSVVETGINVGKLRPTRLAKEVFKGTAQGVLLSNTPSGQERTQSAPMLPQRPPAQPPVATVIGGSCTAASSSGRPAAAAAAAAAASGGVAASSAAAAAQAYHAAGGLAGGLPGPAAGPSAPCGTTHVIAEGAASGSGVAGASSSGPVTGRVVSGDVVDGVVVSGPVPAHPVAPFEGHHYALYPPIATVSAVATATASESPGDWGAATTAAVAAAAAAAAAASPGGVPEPSGPPGLPYPPVSSAQYAARYYPAVPSA